METKEIVKALRCCYYHNLTDCEDCEYNELGGFCVELLKRDAAKRLEELEAEIAKLKQQLSTKQPEWISVENGKEMPDAFSYTGIRHDQFPRLVVAIDENSHVTHWMMLDAPKPKEPTFKDVFLKAFPKAKIEESIPKFCVEDVFPWVKYPHCNGRNCDKCWDQLYFEEEGAKCD